MKPSMVDIVSDVLAGALQVINLVMDCRAGIIQQEGIWWSGRK
jgi:hypothetical protein